MKIVVTGAAGLVGQNLIPRLKTCGFDIVAIDRHPANTHILAQLHPEITVVQADLADPGEWASALDGADSVIMAHAQIGGLVEEEFTRNNIIATERLIDSMGQRGCSQIVHISSSVVNSMAMDWYTQTKTRQEALVRQSGFPHIILRPTLMFGWFDRKHLGWLARFMRESPVFPVPGNGRFPRQPLYAGDFCNIIVTCIERRLSGEYNISGQRQIDYIDLIRLVRDASGARTQIIKVPYRLFWLMLKAYGLIDKNPPFTVKQLEALMAPDIFEVNDWPGIFGVRATALEEAISETFRYPRYSSIVLEF